MGSIAKLLSFIRAERNGAKVSDVKCDPGGGANVTAEHFAPIGEDARPIPGDFVALVPVEGTGRKNALGYIDVKNAQKSAPGEKRIYARDPSNGSPIVEVWLKNDGTAEIINSVGSVTLDPDGAITSTNGAGTHTLGADGSISGSNSAGSYSLGADGTFNANGVTIDPSGAMNVPTSLIVNGKELADHKHSQGVDSSGDTQEDTSPNL